jgi:enoyl-CoA hydratase
VIDLAFQEEFAVLTLNRPDVLNALSFGQLESLEARLDEIEASEARCVIITGAGSKAFSAGADVSELAGRSVEQELDGTLRGQKTISRLDTLRQPSVALVNGYALGGGCELSLACTFRLATPQARFGLPEVKLGLVPGYGGTQRLSRLVGPAFALEVALTGRMIGAEEALEVGLVNHVLAGDDPLEAAKSFARGFTGMSLTAMRFIRDAIRLGADKPLQEALAIEAQASALSYRTADGQEGLSAFLGKRTPHFQDR